MNADGYLSTLTLILPTPKVISLCHQYRARSACTSMLTIQAKNFLCFKLWCPGLLWITINGLHDFRNFMFFFLAHVMKQHTFFTNSVALKYHDLAI